MEKKQIALFDIEKITSDLNLIEKLQINGRCLTEESNF